MLSAWCDDLLALPEEVWSAYALSREPLRGRLDREGYRPYYDRAAACGREEASRLAHAHPGGPGGDGGEGPHAPGRGDRHLRLLLRAGPD